MNYSNLLFSMPLGVPVASAEYEPWTFMSFGTADPEDYRMTNKGERRSDEEVQRAHKITALSRLPKVYSQIDLFEFGTVNLNRPFIESLKRAVDWMVFEMPKILRKHILEGFELPKDTTEDTLYHHMMEYALSRAQVVEAMRDVYLQFTPHAPMRARFREQKNKVTLPPYRKTDEATEYSMRELYHKFYAGLFLLTQTILPGLTDDEIQTICGNPSITVARMERYCNGEESRSESLTSTGIERAVLVGAASLRLGLAATFHRAP